MKNTHEKFYRILMWLVVISFFGFIFLSVTSVKAETLKEEIKTEMYGKNPALKDYHKKQRKMEKGCSLCQPRGLRKLLPKRWR